jgi:preprotein translocase subunit SecG
MLLQLNESQMEKLKEFTKIEAYRLVSKLPEGKSGIANQEEVNLDEFYAQEGGAEILQSQINYNGWKNIETQNEGWSHFANKIPSWIFILFTIFITIMAVRSKLSLIPILGLLSCLYMMSQLALANWIYFTIWLLLGLVIYFLYGRKHSKLAQHAA